MTNETKHTPTPWAFDEYKSVVDERGQAVLVNGFSMVMSYGEDQNVAKANAANIVKCVNMHDELVDVLKSLIILNENYSPFGGGMYQDRIDRAWHMARETIKKAGAL